MKKRLLAIIMSLAMVFVFAGCGGSEDTSAKKTEVLVFAAASMQSSLEELEASFEEANPDVDIILNCDSSGTLMEQIEEGAPCDIFFSAAQKNMDQLEEDGLVVEGTRSNVLNNQLVVVTQPDSDTAVTGLENLKDAKSIALADGSVPVGKYTRQALINLGILEEVEDPSTITTQEVSDALGGVEINEGANVSKVLTDVIEGSSEVGTVYLSDTYGQEDSVKIIETVSYDVTGNIIYPIAQIVNQDADDSETEAAAEVLEYFTNDDAKALYDKHLFDTNVE
ncbi:MAG: molybdate ABC transporter substrate-binding protein [Firmicutes bacterium]|nr:molybdate ABC transporter substrate-binding protein [Bacillota bacterium]